MRLTFALLGVLMLVPLSAAQITEDSATFWVHHTNADGCCDIWFNLLQEDPDHTLDAVGNILLPSAAEVPSQSNPGSPIWHDPNHSTIDYAQEGEVPLLELDPSRAVVFDMYLGGETIGIYSAVPPAPNAGVATVTAVLRQGDTVIATTGAMEVTYNQEFLHITQELAANVTIIDPAAGPMTWDFLVSGVTPAFQIGGGPSTGHTSFTLPLVPPPANETTPAPDENTSVEPEAPAEDPEEAPPEPPVEDAPEPDPAPEEDEPVNDVAPTRQDSQESPGIAFPLVVLSLAGLVLARRQR